MDVLGEGGKEVWDSASKNRMEVKGEGKAKEKGTGEMR